MVYNEPFFGKISDLCDNFGVGRSSQDCHIHGYMVRRDKMAR
jgi:hypothetical protein